MTDIERICKNCRFFNPLKNQTFITVAHEFEVGKRSCNAQDTICGSEPCITGQFEEKAQPEPVA